MALLDNAADGLLGAALTGVVSWLLLRRGRPNRSQYEDAWKRQVDELKRELAAERAATDEQRDQRIVDLKAENRRLRRQPGTPPGGRTDD